MQVRLKSENYSLRAPYGFSFRLDHGTTRDPDGMSKVNFLRVVLLGRSLQFSVEVQTMAERRANGEGSKILLHKSGRYYSKVSL